jgi:hypothetical protein
LQVGGVLVLYAIVIVVIRELAPSSVGYVVLGISILGVIALTARELWTEKKKTANRLKRKSKHA